MFNRPAAIAALCVLLPTLAGCSTTSAFMADNIPTWIGGEPEGIPPRPNDPRYVEYERAQRAKVEDAETGQPQDGRGEEKRPLATPANAAIPAGKT